MVRDGEMAIREMKRLDENIADPGISADIVRLEQVSARIFDEVRTHPEKLPQIRRFLDYYLPTTLKLLNAYDRMSGTGVSGENIDTTLAKVEGMMRTIVAAFEKQLDSLYGAEALDISTEKDRHQNGGPGFLYGRRICPSVLETGAWRVA